MWAEVDPWNHGFPSAYNALEPTGYYAELVHNAPGYCLCLTPGHGCCRHLPHLQKRHDSTWWAKEERLWLRPVTARAGQDDVD